ncbi:ABC transporter ATP-binding protein [Evansella tamaricis]|uniref:ABC transporter ATP-binding protein n=1 Tax=Evansella tamaricis TaxID=2069301 RepID=A0ABS6JQV6_9BACI|nr:ABC transporter ATP-binding protein [Evansella tamaricis]MBU9714785.1 ABC transporter ATP-binding protein [Evansella tamaricis]
MKIKHISKRVHQNQILSDIDFEVKTGSIVGIVGRNGAGKTTLLRTMVGILNPTKGDVLIKNESIFSNPKLKENIIFVPDSSEALKNYSTKEMLNLYKGIYSRFDEEYFHELMDRFSLPEVKKIGNLSKGMKALFSLVVAFSTRAKYILLDEPTDGLDVIVKKRILKILVEEVAINDVSVIISSHRLDELEFMANDIVIIKDGKVEKHYELDSMKLNYLKAQVVFKEYMPEDLKNHITVINQTGRVYTIVFEKKRDELRSLIETFQPILYEELPISLEDIFIATLGGEDIVS